MRSLKTKWRESMKEKTASPKKTEKIPMKKKLTAKKNAFIAFIEKAAHGDIDFNKPAEKLINTAKVFIVSTRKFIEDECLTKASSLTYTIVVSLIPTLTVALMIYPIVTGLDKNKIFTEITDFMLENNINLNIDIFLDAILELVDNAGKIGVISAVVVIFSATAMLRSLEKSLNDIWKITRQRPFMLKIVYYWAALTLGPVMLVAGTTVAAQISEFFSSPNFNSLYVDSGKRLWVAGNKTTLKYHTGEKMKFVKVTTRNIDFDNQKAYRYNSKENTFLREEHNLEPIHFNRTKFHDLQFIGKEGWASGSQGVILHTTDNGNRWNLSKWGSFTFNDIHMISRKRGFLAADNGIFLKTEDGGETWDVLKWEGMNTNFKNIAFRGKHGIVTGTRGTILETKDGGQNWKMKTIAEARLKKRLVNINNAFFARNGTIWLMCDSGIILKSRKGGASWQQLRFKKYNYFDGWFKNNREGIITGSSGAVITTRDGGKSWKKEKLPTYKINDLAVSDGVYWAAGDNGMLMASRDQGRTWKGTEGRSVIGMLLNFIAPFLIIWLLFFLCYLTLPNTRVPVKGAALGAAFTGAVWVLFILGFIVYTKAFARGTFAIYGALASIPLFLLLVYASSVIVLYGAEVSYTLMHPETYHSLKNTEFDRRSVQIYYGIAILHYIYEKFEQGNGATWFKELQKACAYNTGIHKSGADLPE